MEGDPKSESHLTSAAAFVEGGIQDACEAFCDSDPSVTLLISASPYSDFIASKHNVSKKFSVSHVLATNQLERSCKELLEEVERMRSFRFNPSRNATIFHHPTLEDFELQHLPAGVTDAELEERIIQHLAAAAAVGRARHSARRDGHRNRSMDQGQRLETRDCGRTCSDSVSNSVESIPVRESGNSQTAEVVNVNIVSEMFT